MALAAALREGGAALGVTRVLRDEREDRDTLGNALRDPHGLALGEVEGLPESLPWGEPLALAKWEGLPLPLLLPHPLPLPLPLEDTEGVALPPQELGVTLGLGVG